MTYVIIILIVLAVALAIALIWTAMKRKKDQVGRERANELRSEAATTASAKHEQEARAREAEAEAARVRAQADRLESRAHQERTGYDMTQAQQEDAVREADRLDPDVDHRSAEYEPDLNGSPVQRTERHATTHPEHHGSGDANGTWSGQPSTGPADPVPSGPETIVPGQEHPDHRN